DLFAAFALGSFVGSVFANVLGPSIVWHQSRTGERVARWLDHLVLPALVGIGVSLVLAAQFLAGEAALLGRPLAFWEAVGVSLCGGAVMLAAQRQRLTLLQIGSGVSLFGADLLINLLLLMAIPFAFALWGARGLVMMYAVNALLCLVFYSSAGGAPRRRIRRAGLRLGHLHTAIGGALLLPVFFQLGQGIYRSVEPLLDSGGQLLAVPIPIAVAACVAAVYMLGHFQRAQRGGGFLFLFFVGLLLATIISTEGHLAAERAKLILLLQVLVPVLGLVLGQMIVRPAWPSLARGFLMALWIVVPAELLISWLHGSLLLQHDLLLFSIYQHRQYVPVVLEAAFLFALAVAPARSGPQARWLLPLMTLYAIASTSVLAMVLLFLGVGLLVRLRPAMLPSRQLLSLLAALGIGYLALALPSPEFRAKFAFDTGDTESALLPDAFRAHVAVWADYLSALLREPRHLVFGFPHPPDRTVLTNANNYYLDFIYNFGILALLPLLYLFGHTLGRLFRLRAQLQDRPEILMLAAIVIFLLVADNGWKVALRQPYSGLLSFFLWGLLLSELARLRAPATQTSP
ncbi:MAG: hypothetical protein KGM49_15895, partial [Sphingomonadales bacterium]|nr:hypothetical protein [Sphingomonadales bacterium]